MPIVSENQRKAMQAAAHGRSTLGIPKSVAEKFLAHDFASLTSNSAVPAGLRKQAEDAIAGLDMSEEDWRGLLDGLLKFFAEESRESEHAADAEPKTLYVHRKVLNPTAILEWARAAGFKSTLPPDDLHVTVAYSKTPVDWGKFAPEPDDLANEEGAPGRAVERLGADGEAVVLRFSSPSLEDRWKAFVDGGASWDYPEYRPHLTISYDAGDVDVNQVEPYAGEIQLGPEVFAEVKSGWMNDVKEVATDSALKSAYDVGDEDLAPFIGDASFNESDHPRAPDGKFGSGGASTGAHGGPHHVIREKGDPRAAPSEKEAQMLGLQPKRPKPEDRSSHKDKKPISAEELSQKLRGMTSEKLRAYASNKDVDPLIRAHVNRELTSRLMTGDSALSLALDRDSVRERRKDGQLVVKVANISKANVCPYRGSEIPGWEKLGLEPDRIYNLLRDPEELKKAAPTLNGVQLLAKHIPVNADDHRPMDTVGSLGTDAEFDGEYLKNSLFVNAKSAIDGIESGEKRELSAGYHYTPDMTPGNFRGTRYDGVMRDIVFNHVALVEDGRAGPDVVVGDSRENVMKPTRFAAVVLAATASHIAPLLAMDSKVRIGKDAFVKLSPKTYKDQRGAFLSGVRSAIDGKLRSGIALDATMEDLAKAVDAFAGLEEEVQDEGGLEEIAEIAPQPSPTAPDKTTYDAEPLKAFLREKGMGEDDIGKVCDMLPKPGMTGDEDDDADKDKDKEPPAMDAKNFVSKVALDEALKAQGADFQKQIAAVRENERGIRTAIATVKPWVGELAADLAFDSASGVYRHALKMRGFEGADKLHDDALLPILRAQPLPGARPSQDNNNSIAMDASVLDKAAKIAPGLAGIQTVA